MKTNHLHLIKLLVSLVIVFIFINSCKVDNKIIDVAGSAYPKEIAKIILNKCAISGCHNAASNAGAAKLNLETFDKMFEGTSNGATVIPYWYNQSTMFLFCNTYKDLGLQNLPTMPINAPILSREEVVTIKTWINNGAPRSDGYVKFSDYGNNTKYYVTNQGCDIVNVINPDLLVPMRYVSVGSSPRTESPHQVHVSPDGKYWYCLFLADSVIQKYSTSNDAFIGEIKIPQGNWNTFVITNDGKNAYAVDWSSNGKVIYVDLENRLLKRIYPTDWFTYPHGVALSPDNKILYVLAQYGNAMYKIDVTNPLYPELINGAQTIDGTATPEFNPTAANSLNPHEIKFAPNGNSYYITCQRSNQVRVYNAQTDQQIAVINTGSYPQEMAFSTTKNYLFVTCTEDTVTEVGKRGSVAIIDFSSNSLISKVYVGHQPHGIDVDDKNNLVVVANRNASNDGPAPHHATDCVGRNGNIAFINLSTLKVLNKKIEVTVDPYFVAVKY